MYGCSADWSLFFLTPYSIDPNWFIIPLRQSNLFVATDSDCQIYLRLIWFGLEGLSPTDYLQSKHTLLKKSRTFWSSLSGSIRRKIYTVRASCWAVSSPFAYMKLSRQWSCSFFRKPPMTWAYFSCIQSGVYIEENQPVKGIMKRVPESCFIYEEVQYVS